MRAKSSHKLLPRPRVTSSNSSEVLQELIGSAGQMSTCVTSKSLRRVSICRLREHISTILRSPPSLSSLLQRSFWHPLGFLKLQLGQSDTGERVRLHIWAPEHGSPAETHIHSHYWNFSSRLLCGRVRMTTFAEVEGSCALTCDTWMLTDFRINPSISDTYRFQYRGVSRLVKTEDQLLHPGSVYSLRAEDFHYVSVASTGVTASLVLQGPPVVKSTKVLVPARIPHLPPTTGGQRGTTRTEVVSALEALHDELGDSGA